MREGWEIKKLGEVCDFQGGSQPPKGEWISEPREGYVRMLQIRDFTQKRSSDIEFVKKSNRLKYCQETDILLGRYGASVGKVLTGLAGAYNVAIIKTMPDETLIDRSFFKYFLLSPHFQDFLQHASKMRAAQAGFSKEDIQDYLVFVPPLSEQKRIVAELDLLSEVIAKKREQLTQLDALAQSLFYTMFGDPITNEKGWETKSIDKICVSKKEIKRASSVFSKDDRIIYIDISSIDNVNNIIMSPTIYNFGEAPSRAQQVVQKGDILISLVRPNLNNVSLITTANPNLVASSGFCVLRATNEINTQYLFFFVKMDHCREYLMQRVAGANYPAIKTEDIMRYKISLPPLALQQQFAEKIEAIEQQKERIRQSLAEVQLLFDSRMDYYFNEWAE